MRRIREIRIRNRNLEDRRPRQVKKNILKDSKAWTGSWSKCKGVKEADYYKCSIRRKIVKKIKTKGKKIGRGGGFQQEGGHRKAEVS